MYNTYIKCRLCRRRFLYYFENSRCHTKVPLLVPDAIQKSCLTWSSIVRTLIALLETVFLMDVLSFCKLCTIDIFIFVFPIK